MKIKITVLGCGPALGVPLIGCKCKVCVSALKYNKRTRPAIYMRLLDTAILIDFGCDIRMQLLREKIDELDAIILTHYHADHCHGIDDLKVFSFYQKKAIKLYGQVDHLQVIQNRFSYLLSQGVSGLILNNVEYDSVMDVSGIKIQFFEQIHGDIKSLGLRIGSFVYSIDVVDFPVQSEKYLYNIDTWIVDCLQYQSTKNHAGLDKILEWNKRFTPKKIFLTDMNHNIDYKEIKSKLPKNIIPLHDGYQLSISV